MNPNQDNNQPLVAERLPTSEDSRSFFQRVYTWMCAGLLMSGLVAYFVASTDSWVNFIFGTPFLFYGLLIAQILLVVWLSRGINKMSSHTASVVFILYSFLTGLTLSTVFMAYTTESINTVFFITAGMFGVISIYGHITKADLSKIGQIAFMGLMGLILAGLVNLFVKSSQADLILSGIGVLVFSVLTAYDTQKIKNLAATVQAGSEAASKAAIIGALTLYLDFINLFLDLLRFFGRRRN